MEPAQVARFTREIRALGKAASWDAESLAQAVSLQRQLDAEITLAARSLNAQGFSWAEIGAALGITRTAAHKRYAATASRCSFCGAIEGITSHAGGCDRS